jgi:hypothetical protein
LALAVVFIGGRRRRWRRLDRSEHERREVEGRKREDDVQLLEVRLARLEERIEFTEKLLMDRPPQPDRARGVR